MSRLSAHTPRGTCAHDCPRRRQIYDTTLRDGSQQEGISLTVDDKLPRRRAARPSRRRLHRGRLARRQSEGRGVLPAGRRRAEAGARPRSWPSARRGDAGGRAEDDDALRASRRRRHRGRLHRRQVVRPPRHRGPAHDASRKASRWSADSVAFLRAVGLRVFFDAEHFFDGYAATAEFALRVLEAAEEAGAEALVLCDTNGGMLPDDVERDRGRRAPPDLRHHRRALPQRCRLRRRQHPRRRPPRRDAGPRLRERLRRAGGQRRPLGRRSRI